MSACSNILQWQSAVGTIDEKQGCKQEKKYEDEYLIMWLGLLIFHTWNQFYNIKLQLYIEMFYVLCSDFLLDEVW